MAGRDLSSELFGPEGGGGRDFSADLFGPSEAVRKSTIGSEIVRGGKQLASSVRTGFGALTGSPEEAAIAGVARGQAIGEEAGEGASLEAVKKAYQERGLLSAAGEVASQIPRALAGQVPQLAAMAGGAKLGAMAGSALGPAGTIGGGIVGAGATLLPQFFGSNVERQASEQMAKDQPVQIDRGAAGAAAAGQAAIESAGTAFVLGKRIVKGVLGIADDAALTTAKAQQAMTQAAERSLAAAAGRGVAKGVATEIPVEIASSVLERAQAGLDVTSPEAMAEYGEVAYQAGLVGGAIGAGAGPVDTAMARQGVKARTAFEEAEAKRVADAEKARLDAEAAEKAKIPPLALGSEGVFTPVALPDGSVAMTREDLAQYEESQFQKKYAPQEGEKPYAPAPSLTGTDLTSRLAQRPGEGGMEDLIASRRVAEEDARVEEMRRARVFPEGELDKQNILRTDRDAGLMSGMSERRAEREAAEKKEEQRLARVASQEEKARIARLGGIESPLVAAGRERFTEAARLEEEAAAKRAADEKKAAEAEAKAARLPAPAGLSQAMAGVPVGGELAGMISGRREAEAAKAEVPLDDDYAFLQREKQRLLQQDQTPDTKKLIGRIDDRIGEVLKRDIERQRADAEAAKTSVFGQEQLPEVESRDVVVGNLELGKLQAAERLPDEPLTGREVKSIEKMRTAPPPVPDAQARLEQAEMDRRKFMRSKDAKQGNLMKYLEGKLALDEVSDIAPKGKGFEKLANEKGTYISELVSDGMLDEFLPPDQRAGQANFDAQQAAETIKENLRNKVLQPFDTQTQIRQLDDSIAAAEREAKEPSTAQFDLSEVEPGEAATVERAAGDQVVVETTDQIRYKRATGKVGIGKQAVQDTVDTVKARWANAPEVVVAENMDDPAIPQEVRDHNKEAVAKGAKGSPQGFYYKGKAYVIADSIGSTNEAVEALMHEALGHFGLRGVFGPKMETVLRDVIKNRRAEVESKAEQYGLDPNNDKDMLEAAEEVLAVMAQTKPGLPFVKRALAVIRNFLRDLGFNIKMSDADIIQKYILPARAFVESGKGRPTGGKPAAMRGEAPKIGPGSEAFKRWSGGLPVHESYEDRSSDRGIFKLFHMTRADFSEFIPGGLDPMDSGPAIFLSTNPSAGSATFRVGSEQRGFREGARTMPVYAKLKSPLVVDSKEMLDFARESFADGSLEFPQLIAKETVDALKSEGYDSVIFDGKGVGWRDAENEILVFNPTQIKSATGNIGTYDPDNADIRYSRQNIKGQPVLAQWTTPNDTKLYGETGKDDIIYSLQNKMIDTKRVVDAISATAGKIMAKWNPYLQEELFHGRTAKQTADFLKKELRPLMQDMSERGVNIKDFEEYLHNRHAEDYNKHVAKINPKMPDGGSGIETADARAYLAGLTPQQKTDFEALAKKIDAINKGTREVLVDGGLETRDLINEWEGAFPSYVPLKREELDYAYTAGGMGTGQGFDVRGNFSRRATGSERGVIDILANSAMQRERAIIKAEKNRVAQAMFGLAVQSPNPDFWLPIDPMAEVDPSAAQDLLSFGLSQQDLDFLMKEPRQKAVDKNSGQVVERINATLRNNENVMSMRFNGRDRYVFFNPNNPRSARMISSLKNLDADQLGYILGNVSKITRWFASVNTQYNPIFGAYNFLRDVQGAALQLSDTPLAKDRKAVVAGTLPALKGIYSALRAERDGQVVNTPWATLWNEFQEEGGQTGFRDQFSRSQERAEALEKELKMVTEGKLKSAGRGMINWLSDYNDSMENAVRLSAYKAALDRGIGKQEAASIAKNLTVNFNRKGQIAAQAGALYAFFNAAVQGTTRLAQTLRGPAGKKIMAGGFLLGTMQAALLAAAGFDDEEPPEFVRERNLILPIGGDKYLTFPMPLGYHVIPSTSRIITEWALSGFKDTPDRIASLTGMYLEAFNPVGNAGWSAQTLAPTFADPIVALTENRDWTGKPIARKDFSNLDPTPGYTRAKDTASEFSTQIAKFLNYASGGTEFKPGVLSPTPDQLDYLIGQVTGGIGREVLKAEQTALKTATGEELPPYKIPVVGRFYGETKSSAAESGRFYKNLTKLNEHENEIKGRRENREPIAEYMQENPEARLAPLARKTYSDIQKLRKRKEQLLDRDAPRESIKQVEDMITKRMQVFNARVEALRK
jgi:hypothetical protein